MSDRIDAELKRAIKESTARSLEGWEFTPAMRQAVLNRIAAESGHPSPASARRSGQPLVRPLFWAAAAAAALILAINLVEMAPGSGGVAEKAEKAPLAALDAQGSQESVPSAQPPDHAVTGGHGAAKDQEGGKATSAAVGQMAATSPGQDGDQESAAVKSMPSQVAAAAPARIHLAVPEPSGPVSRPGEPPVTALGGSGNTFTALAAPPEMLSMIGVRAGAAVRTSTSIRMVDAGGAVIWERPLAGGPGPMAGGVTAIAAGAGNEIYLFDPDGQQKAKLALPGPPQSIALGPDGRVAALVGPARHPEGQRLVVFADGSEQFRVDGLADAAFAFGPDGSLAVADRSGLQLFSREGARLWQVALKAGGSSGVAFAAGGDVIVAGGQGFHRSGQPLWEVQAIRPQGVLTLGANGPVALWDSKAITLVRPEDGTEIWTAEQRAGQTLRVASSDSGDQVAILASLQEGAVVWVLDRHGGLRYDERLSVRPRGVAVHGDALLILTERGTEVRALPPR